jgi:hypothetical protein
LMFFFCERNVCVLGLSSPTLLLTKAFIIAITLWQNKLEVPTVGFLPTISLWSQRRNYSGYPDTKSRYFSQKTCRIKWPI